MIISPTINLVLNCLENSVIESIKLCFQNFEEKLYINHFSGSSHGSMMANCETDSHEGKVFDKTERKVK